MKKLIFLAFVAAFAAKTLAQDAQTGYNFLRLPVSAHAAALGGHNITVVEDDASLGFHNPALLSSVNDKTIGLNFMTYMEGANTASASFTKILGSKATLGVMGQFMSYGKMKEVDENNVITGEFSAKDIAVSGALAYQLGKNIVGGITARFINSYIGDYSSLAMTVDLGVNYYDPVREWSISAVVKNLGGELDAYDQEYTRLPLDLQLGVTKRLIGSPLRLSATLVDLNHTSYKFLHHLVTGADIIISPQFYVAAGYSFRRASEMKIIASGEEKGSASGAGLSFGGGVLMERFKLNVAYGKYHVSSHSIILNASFSL